MTTLKSEIVLIGGGIMSATLGMILKLINPQISIHLFEKLETAGIESSDAWNNAGTGHSAYCELNYTPELEDGTIDISKAVNIAKSFVLSKQFWSFLVKENILEHADFIHSVPHMTFVKGEKDVVFLKKRYDALIKESLFKEMVFTEDPAEIKKLIPLVMEGRNEQERVAATYMQSGTDIDFGKLTRMVINSLKKMPGVYIYYNHEVKDLEKNENQWLLKVLDINKDEKIKVSADFVFIGAGGKSLTLLEKSDIEEGKGYGGFPVSGQWLVCNNQDVIARHHAKVYGKASVGSPPMSVPHLDTRVIHGKKELLFGPFAGFSTKFLKNGSFMDLPLSIHNNNIIPMLAAGFHNIPLTRYLIGQVSQSMDERIYALREYLPNANKKDWELKTAGMRVQVIKKDPEELGVLEFGTEVICAKDGSIAALLGASPGASTAVNIMINLIKRCFNDKPDFEDWHTKLSKILPSLDENFNENQLLQKIIIERTNDILNLN